MVQKQKVTYKKVKAIRYKLQKFTETQMQMSSKMVKKTEITLKRIPVQVPVTPIAQKDCCGRDINVPISCDSCQPTMQFVTKYIMKEVPVTVEVPETIEVAVDVEVQRRVPYEVEVNEPVISFESMTENYVLKVPEEKLIKFVVTETIPVVTRQCTDALGNVISQLDQLPLHASGPTRAQLNIGNEKDNNSPMRSPMIQPQARPDEPKRDPRAEREAMWTRFSQDASLVLTPLDM